MFASMDFFYVQLKDLQPMVSTSLKLLSFMAALVASVASARPRVSLRTRSGLGHLFLFFF